MAWVYIDDGFFDHPKVARAGGDAAWLYVCGLGYCKRYGTEGTIPKAQVPRLSDRRGVSKLVTKLLEVALWHDAGDHYEVHDFSEWNKPAASRSEAGRKAANARWHRERNADADANASESHVPQDALSPSPSPSQSSSPPSASSDGKGTRIPNDFAVTPELRDWARTHAPSVNLERETANFVDYWRAKPGKDGVKRDWPATWRTWMRRAHDRTPQSNGTGQQVIYR